jgi:hypothetical protein
MTARDLCLDAMLEIGAIAPGEAMSAGDGVFVLGKLNRLLDNWNADRAAVYASAFTTYTLVPALSPHTIGPASLIDPSLDPTWIMAQRPVEIVSASYILTGGTVPVYQPINVVDNQWWAGQSVPTLSIAYPSDLYYQPDWPAGKLYFWPVPSSDWQVELQTRVLLTALALNDTFTLPQGYQDAVTLTLAESIATAYGTQPSPMLRESALKARARIFANNDVTPDLVTRDAGMPGGGGSYLNWRSGLMFD